MAPHAPTSAMWACRVPSQTEGHVGVWDFCQINQKLYKTMETMMKNNTVTNPTHT